MFKISAVALLLMAACRFVIRSPTLVKRSVAELLLFLLPPAAVLADSRDACILLTEL